MEPVTQVALGHDAFAAGGDVHATGRRDASVTGKDGNVGITELLQVVIDPIRWVTRHRGVHPEQHGVHIVFLGASDRGRTSMRFDR